MKPGYLFKIVLLALPVVLLIYVFLIRDRLSAGPGTGGGSYDLTKLYTLMAVGLYLVILNLVLLMQTTRANSFFLLAGVILLIGTILIAIHTF